MTDICFLLFGWLFLSTLRHHVDSATIDKRLIFLDKQCFKEFKKNLASHDIHVRKCKYPLIDQETRLHASPNLPGYRIHIYSQKDSDQWVPDIAWDVPTNFCDHKLLVKARFASRDYNVIKEDKLCFEFSKIEETHVHEVNFSCLRLEHGQKGTLKLTHLPESDDFSKNRARYKKDDFNTECECTNQRAHVHYDNEDYMVRITFNKMHAVTGYRVNVENSLTKRQIVEPRKININDEEIIEYKTIIGSVDDNVNVKIEFWCSDSRKKYAQDRICHNIVRHMSQTNAIITQLPPLTERSWDYKDVKTIRGLAFFVVVPVVLIVILVTAITFRKQSFDKCRSSR